MDSPPQPFANRTVAGIELARAVQQRVPRVPGLVLGLPRGGVPVAHEIARVLARPLDVMPVRKIGMPGNSEYAIGAIAGKTVVHESNLSTCVSTEVFAKLVRMKRAELCRRERMYRAGLPPLNLTGMEVLLVDDGLATGCTMLAAVREARRLNAELVLVAAPVASERAVELVRAEADGAIILEISADLLSVGTWYDDFSQVEDSQVCDLLARDRLAMKPASYA